MEETNKREIVISFLSFFEGEKGRGWGVAFGSCSLSLELTCARFGHTCISAMTASPEGKGEEREGRLLKREEKIREGKGSLCPHRDPYGSIDLLPHWRRHLCLDHPNASLLELLFRCTFQIDK